MQCYSKKWDAWHDWVVAAAILYALGAPYLFYCLVRRYKDAGKRGDKVVEGAIRWMCKYRISLQYRFVRISSNCWSLIAELLCST